MKLLLILLTVMTFTVKDKSTVTADGIWPYDMDCRYSCTYQKGTVRANDTATLVVTGLSGICVESIDVYVKSNKSNGSGVFSVSSNGHVLATLSGSLKDWYGAFDNELFHPIRVLSGQHPNIRDLSVVLVGTDNSLYIEKYVITYATAPTYTVTLMDGGETYSRLTEEQGGAGVQLPSMANHGEWVFCGWAQADFGQRQTKPAMLPTGRYCPTADVTLYAVYTAKQTTEDYVSTLQSGEYIYMNRESGLALAGPVLTDGKMSVLPADPDDPQQIYYITFSSDLQTATIYYEPTGKYIGYSGTSLSARESDWSVYHDGNQTLFYAPVSDKQYVLWLGLVDGAGNDYAGLLRADNLSSPMGLLPAGAATFVQTWTCHPEFGLNFVEPDIVYPEYIMQIGNYQLLIRNGKKYLQL